MVVKLLIYRFLKFSILNIALFFACIQRPGGLAKLGIDCTPFGLSLPPKGRAEIRVITLHPNFAKPLVMCWHLFHSLLYFFAAL